MEKKETSYAMDVCEKLYKAVTVFPAFQRVRRISQVVQRSRSASPASSSSPPASSVKIIGIQSKPPSPKPPKSSKNEEADAVVPINFDYSSQNEKPKPATPLEPIQKKTQKAEVASKIETSANTIAGEVSKLNPKVKLKKESGTSGVHIEYITDRSMYKSGEAKNRDKLSGNGPAKDKFSDYIERTKKKLIGDEEEEERL